MRTLHAARNVGGLRQHSHVTWIDATEAVAAVVGAVGTPAAVLVAARSLRWQQRQDLDRAARSQLEQPRRVVVDTEVRDWPTVDGSDTYRTVVASVRNLGTDPVYETALQWRTGDRQDAGVDVKGVLLPGVTWEQPAPTQATHKASFDQIRAFVTFFDQDSRGWAMTESGDLVRLRDAVEEAW